jgi:SAM-dependent methyltransferase
MLAALGENAKRLGLDVKTAAAEAETLPFPDESFDLVFGHAVLHHIPDLGQAFSEFARVLRPGGWLAVLSRYPSPTGRITALVEQTRYAFTGDGHAGIPAWTSMQAPSNLLGLEQAGFTGYTRRVFANPMVLSLEGYLNGMTNRASRADISAEDYLVYQARLREVLLPLSVNGQLREPFFDYVFMAQKPPV